jgi:hypothetical protein
MLTLLPGLILEQQACPDMFRLDQCPHEFDDAMVEDAWYELEGAYEVFGIGRYRFVLSHCRTALLIGIVLLMKKRGCNFSDQGFEMMGMELDMPHGVMDSCIEVERAGRFVTNQGNGRDDQEEAAMILSKTLEAFEWIRANLDE